ncbi:hypothetical protein PEDI_53380 [Persicobacter diffluens]|uniref:Uncharacterized protein n=1 Tax=Persicobacter diffluens TaxID=981 RepID=A0AAN4W509_9BACT|nr:hypothetical protein PEDI_53380 [Persicobacter diffluens]
MEQFIEAFNIICLVGQGLPFQFLFFFVFKWQASSIKSLRFYY